MAALMPSRLLGDDRVERVIVADAVAVLTVDTEEEDDRRRRTGSAVCSTIVCGDESRRT